MTRFSPTHLALLLSQIGLASCDQSGIPTQPGPAEQTETAEAQQVALAVDTWASRAKMPTGRHGLAATALLNSTGQSIVYAIGGTGSDGHSLRAVEAYNVSTNSWSTKTSLPEEAEPEVGVIGGKIYSLNLLGMGRRSCCSTALYMYDPATNAWTAKRALPAGMQLGLTGVINGKLYVVNGSTDYDCGGDDCGEEDPQLYRYDPATDEWSYLPGCPSKHLNGAAAVINGKFYVAGGVSGNVVSNKLHVYDPVTNAWSEKAPMPRRRYSAAGAHLNGQFYVVGGIGKDYNTRLNLVQAYNLATNTWTTKAPMSIARSELAAVRVILNGQQRIVAVGGVGGPRVNEVYTP
jgi:Kelch motif protein